MPGIGAEASVKGVIGAAGGGAERLLAGPRHLHAGALQLGERLAIARGDHLELPAACLVERFLDGAAAGLGLALKEAGIGDDMGRVVDVARQRQVALHLGQLAVDDAEMHEIDANRLGQRHQERRHQHQDRAGLHQRAQHQQQDIDQQQHHQRVVADHTLALAGLQLVTNPGLIANLGYNPRADLAMAGQLTAMPVVVMASAASRITTMAEAVARSRQPGNDVIRIAAAGTGTSSHLGGELLFRAVGGWFEAVQYRGGAPAFQALMTGDAEMMFDLVAAYQAPAAAEGRVRMLGVMQQARTPGLPDVPSFGEFGLPPAAMMRSWQGICVRAGAPPGAIAALHAATVATARAPDFVQRLSNLGIEPTASADPAAFQAFYLEELGRWTALIREAGITAQ